MDEKHYELIALKLVKNLALCLIIEKDSAYKMLELQITYALLIANKEGFAEGLEEALKLGEGKLWDTTKTETKNTIQKS